MNDKGILALNLMVRRVSESQDCVLELIIGEDGMLAHLIPLDTWDDPRYFDEEDE